MQRSAPSSRHGGLHGRGGAVHKARSVSGMSGCDVGGGGTATANDGPEQELQHHHGTYELVREDLTFGKQLGHGQFGEVYLGTCKGTGCAIKKQIIDPNVADHLKVFQDDFIVEATIQQGLSHRNIVEMLGVIMLSEPKHIVLELLATEFIDYLRERKRRSSFADEMDALCRLCHQLATGVEFIHEQEIVHCDLAARNVMVSDEGICKISDFGLARKHGTSACNVKKRVFPISVRWSAPEVKAHRIMSKATDVWSLGVMLYETLTAGETPYKECSKNKQVAEKVEGGYRMPQCEFCPDVMYQLLMSCWDTDQDQRPSAQFIAAKMPEIIMDTRSNKADINAKRGGGYSNTTQTHADHGATIEDEDEDAVYDVRGSAVSISGSQSMLWFHGKASYKRIRELSEPLLIKQGDFLLHKDLTGGDYILSVYTNHPISIKIKKRANGGYRAGRSALFGTCIELIQHHIDHGQPIVITGADSVKKDLHLINPIPYDPEDEWSLEDTDARFGRMSLGRPSLGRLSLNTSRRSFDSLGSPGPEAGQSRRRIARTLPQTPTPTDGGGNAQSPGSPKRGLSRHGFAAHGISRHSHRHDQSSLASLSKVSY